MTHPSGSTVQRVLRVTLMAILAAGEASASPLTLSWDDNSGGVAAFSIERSDTDDSVFAVLANVEAGTTSYADVDALDGSTYCYRVQAYDATGVSGYSNVACHAATASADSITVATSGSGTGRVTSTPAGIDCGSTCLATYPAGTAVVLSSAPDEGSVFIGWSGACTGTTECTVTVEGSVTMTATFERLPPAITVWSSGWGMVVSNPVGIMCDPDCSATFPPGTTVMLTAMPKNDAASFVAWSGDCAGEDLVCTLTVTGPLSVGATFKEGNAP